MKTLFNFRPLCVAIISSAALCSPLHAVILNGGFESGFSDWSLQDQVGGDGTFHLQAGTTSPVSLETVPAPPGGTSAAMTDADGPGSHVLFQTFTVTGAVLPTILEFDLYIGNRASDFFAPDTLDFATGALNQQARVDILPGGADPFSVAPGDILLNAFKTNPGDSLVSGYRHYTVDITALLNANLNQPLMLRFAETDNVFPFQFGVDNVQIRLVPDSFSWALTLGVMVGTCWVGGFAGRRRLHVGINR